MEFISSWKKQRIERKKSKILKEEALKREFEIERSKRKKYDQAFSSLSLFPGNLDEYEKLVGYTCEIIELKGKKKFIEWDGPSYASPLREYSLESQERMLNEGIEALIHYSEDSYSGYYHGVPIKKKKN